MNNITAQPPFIEMQNSAIPYPDYEPTYSSRVNDTGHDYYFDFAAPCIYSVHAELSVLYSLFFVVGFLGNALVIWVVLMGVRLRSMTDICILNLAIADLLLVSFLPFLAHYEKKWIYDAPICTMVHCVNRIGFYSGIFFIVLMSIDRYLAVVHAVFALKVRAKTYGILASLFVWAIALAASFPELTHLLTLMKNNQAICPSYPYTNHNIIFKMNVVGLILPLLVIVFCYSMILIKLLTVRTSRRKAMSLVIVVMVVFFLCWAPYNITAFVSVLELKNGIVFTCEKSKTINLSLQITEAIAYSHSCLSPVLYVFVGKKYRRHLFRLLHRTPVSKLWFMKSYIVQATGSV